MKKCYGVVETDSLCSPTYLLVQHLRSIVIGILALLPAVQVDVQSANVSFKKDSVREFLYHIKIWNY